MSDWNQFDHDKYQTLHNHLKKHAQTRNELGYTFYLYQGTHRQLATELGWTERQLGLTHSYMAKAKNAEGLYICEIVQAPTKAGNGIYYCSPYETEWAVQILELARYVAEGFATQGKQVTSWIEGLADRAEAVAASARNTGNYDAWRALKNTAEGLTRNADDVKRATASIIAYVGPNS